MTLHTAISFESEICEYLADHGWLYAKGDAANYDRARALFPTDVLAWVQATQPKAWDVLAKNHGAQAGEVLLTRLRKRIEKRRILAVLIHGIKLLHERHAVLITAIIGQIYFRRFAERGAT